MPLGLDECRALNSLKGGFALVSRRSTFRGAGIEMARILQTLQG